MNSLGNLSPEMQERLRRVYERTFRERREAEEKARQQVVKAPAVTAPDNKNKNPTLDNPIQYETAFLLEGKFGQDFLREYNARVARDYTEENALKALKVLNLENNKVVGSNPFAVVLANQILNPIGIRSANQAELELILKENKFSFEGRYEESSLVWRSDAEPNEYFAKNISSEMRSHGLNLKNNSAYVIPLYALSLRADANSPHKLSFILNNPELVFEADILMSKHGSYINPSEMNQNGLPSKVYESAVSGNRKLWIGDSGLSGLCLNGSLVVDSIFGNLAYSDSGGQVVCISGEAAAPVKFEVKP